MLKKFALIVAGGSGNRMNSEVPKQFIEIQGKPLLMHTFEAFSTYDSNIEFILVLPQSEENRWRELCTRYKFSTPHQLAYGGKNRFQSVRNGLDQITEEGIVFIHDGVRPFVSESTLQNCERTTVKKGNALPVIPPSESVRFIEKDSSKALDRSKYYLVQTPQTFKVNLIKKAYEQDYSELFTDDASVLEQSGVKINTVAGNRENIKITYPTDLITAEILLQK